MTRAISVVFGAFAVSARTGAAILLLVLITIPARAQDKPNFEGGWLLDTAASTTSGGGRGGASGKATGGGEGRGGGIGLGAPAAELNIRQDAATLTIEERRGADLPLAIVYRLDGRRTTNQMGIGGGRTADGIYTTKWNGAKLVTAISRTVASRGRVTRVEYRESRYLLDPTTMVVETMAVGRPVGRKAVYRKRT